MNEIHVESSLTNNEIINSTQNGQIQDSVSFFCGNISNMEQIFSSLKDIMKTDAAENVCEQIRTKWNTINNIFICQRKETNNLVVCVSSDNPAVSLCAVNTAVGMFMDLVLSESSNCTIFSTQGGTTKESFNNREEGLKQISEHLIQINASTEEINKRIDAFIQRKQEEVNASNIRDFCVGGVQPKNCARVDAVLVTRKDSKSHVRVRRVVNAWGPQTHTEVDSSAQTTLSPSLESKVEVKTEFNDVSRQESSSDCDKSTLIKEEDSFKTKKRNYTVADLESKLESLQQKLKVRR